MKGRGENFGMPCARGTRGPGVHRAQLPKRHRMPIAFPFLALWFSCFTWILGGSLAGQDKSPPSATSVGVSRSWFGSPPPAGDLQDAVVETMIRKGDAMLLAQQAEAYLRLFPATSPQRSRWLVRWIEATSSSHPLGDEAIDAMLQQIDRKVSEELENTYSLRGSLQLANVRARLNLAKWQLSQFLTRPKQIASRDKTLQLTREGRDLLESFRPRWQQEWSRRAVEARKSQSSPWGLWINESWLLEIELIACQAECYPVGSPDRLAAAQQMRSSCEAAKERIGPDWGQWNDLELIHLESLAELGDWTAMESLQKGWADRSFSPQQHGRWTSIQARSAIAQKRWEAAQEALAKGQGIPSPWVDLATLQLELARQEATSDPGSSPPKNWLDQLLQRRDAIGQQHGTLWKARADALLTTRGWLTQGAPSNSQVALLRSEALQWQQAQQWDRAIESLESARQSLQELQEVTLLEEVTRQGALVFRQAGRHRDGARWLQQSATWLLDSASTTEDRKKAADLDWMSIQSIQREPQTEPAKERWREVRERLDDHRRRFAESPHRRAACRAIDQMAAQQNLMLDAWELWIEELEQTPGDDEAWAMSLLRFQDVLDQSRFDPNPLDPARKNQLQVRWIQRIASSEASSAPPDGLRQLAALMATDLRWRRWDGGIPFDPSLQPLLNLPDAPNPAPSAEWNLIGRITQSLRGGLQLPETQATENPETWITQWSMIADQSPWIDRLAGVVLRAILESSDLPKMREPAMAEWLAFLGSRPVQGMPLSKQAVAHQLRAQAIAMQKLVAGEPYLIPTQAREGLLLQWCDIPTLVTDPKLAGSLAVSAVQAAKQLPAGSSHWWWAKLSAARLLATSGNPKSAVQSLELLQASAGMPPDPWRLRLDRMLQQTKQQSAAPAP